MQKETVKNEKTRILRKNHNKDHIQATHLCQLSFQGVFLDSIYSTGFSSVRKNIKNILIILKQKKKKHVFE